jgi:uncharacterized membrane protein YoaK (UPF0700 family)
MERASRTGYLALAGLFTLGVIAQVYLVGLSLLGGRSSWDLHIALGHTLGILAILMIPAAYLGRLPRPMKPLTWLAFGIYALLVIAVLLRPGLPLVAALHPVLAIVLFALTGMLTVRAWRLVRRPVAEAPQVAMHSATPGASPSKRAA